MFGSVQVAAVTPGFTNVLVLALGLTGEPEKRSAFSHRITPDQFSVNTLSVISNAWLYGPGSRLSLPDSDTYSGPTGKPRILGPVSQPLWTNVLPRTIAL